MPEIRMVSFVDFVLANGPTRLTRVRVIKEQMEEEYSPATDFYKGIREAIVDFHEQGLPLAYFNQVIQLAHSRKQAHYSAILKGYRKFLRSKQIETFSPHSASWSYRNLTVSVNPELGLKVDGSAHLVKLYFKSERLSQRRVEVVLHLMRRALGSQRRTAALLDTREGRMYTSKAKSDDMEAFLIGEAAAFREMWQRA